MDKERATLGSFSSHIPPQSQSCEQLLGCSVEGVERDRLLIRFSHLEPSDPEKEATMVLDTATDVYKGRLFSCPDYNFTYGVSVITSSPQLPSMQILVHALNESRDIYTFLKDVRTAFKLLVSTEFDLRGEWII